MAEAMTGNEKISEALRLLEEAAKDKKDDLRNLLSGKYAHLKEAFADREQRVEESLAALKQRAAEAAHKAKETVERKTKEVAEEVDASVRTHPWQYIGGAALTGILLGYILGRNRR